MTDIAATVESYFALWTEPDPVRRQKLIASTFEEDATYVGPALGGNGHDGIGDLATQLQEPLGGYRFNRTSDVDVHHDRVRYSWEIVPPGSKAPLAAGVDFGVIAPDGRLKSITAFLDLAPAGLGEH